MTYSEILRENDGLGRQMAGLPVYEIALVSNIVVNQIAGLLEHALRRTGIHAVVSPGDYDNIPQDSLRFQGAGLVVIFWEACNFRPLFPSNAELLDADEFAALLSALKSEIDFVLGNLAGVPLVLFNRFSSLIFNRWEIGSNRLELACDELNAHLDAHTRSMPNLRLVNTDKVLSVAGTGSTDFRFYYSSKALYSLDFYHAYVEHIVPIVASLRGKARKALIFDCDHTLWKGILGEDGPEKIEMSHRTRSGAVFEEVQALAAGLSQRGVLVGLCSKNNPLDVDNVLRNHPDARLRDRHLSIKRVNWHDKARNLAEIAEELNIGMDSIVFVDDSRFEVELLSRSFPELLVLQVPENLYEYPELIRRTARHFFTAQRTAEDADRGKMYRLEAERQQTKSRFESLDDYLVSLELEVSLSIDSRNDAPRLAQLSQKTNQFNLTTIRYTEAEIIALIERTDRCVVSFSVADKFGGYGLVGMSVVAVDLPQSRSKIETLLMSCRTIGRNVEIAVADFLIDFLRDAGVCIVESAYRATPKNVQTADFYDRMGFSIVAETDAEKTYRLDVADYAPRKLSYIKTTRKNGE